MFFLDSSSLVKLYVDEPGSAFVEQIVDSAEPGALAVSRLATVEVPSAILRKARGAGHAEAHVRLQLDCLDEYLNRRFRVVELGGAVIARAVAVVRRRGLRAADAIQLACALTAREGGSGNGSSSIVSSDKELNAAAQAEGFTVIDPTGS